MLASCRTLIRPRLAAQVVLLEKGRRHDCADDLGCGWRQFRTCCSRYGPLEGNAFEYAVEDPGLYKPFEMLGADYRKWKLKMPQGNIRQPSQATRRFLQPSVARGDEHPSSMFSARAGESFQ